MGAKTERKTKSIKRTITNILLLMMLVLSIVFLVSFTMKNQMIKEYNSSMERSLEISNLSIEINRCYDAFERYIKNRDQDTYNEYFVAQTRIEKILENLDSHIQDEQSSIFIRNLRNMFDYHYDLAGIILEEKSLTSNTYSKFVDLQTLFEYMNKHAQHLSLTYLNYSSNHYSELLTQYKMTEDSIYAAFLSFAMICMIFAMRTLKNVNETIDRLTDSAKLLADADWESPDIAPSDFTELNTLANTFNHMKFNIKVFIEALNEQAELEKTLNEERLKNIENEKLVKESQLKALQVQMDPHFLFNTLNTISRTALFENAHGAVRLIESISKILRYNLSHMGKMVPFNEEITVLKAYTTIQETRFQDQLTFDFDIADGLDLFAMPPMMLQPIVENAIVHGLHNKGDRGTVTIKARQEADYLKIEIEDNGVGMSKSSISKVYTDELIISEKKNSNGIGLRNIRKRLAIRYNMEGLLNFSSDESSGTCVTLKIPMKGSEALC